MVHPEKWTLAKNVLDSRPRMNWSKTQIVEFENDFRKNRFANSFCIINSAPKIINDKYSDLLPNVHIAGLRMADWILHWSYFSSLFRKDFLKNISLLSSSLVAYFTRCLFPLIFFRSCFHYVTIIIVRLLFPVIFSILLFRAIRSDESLLLANGNIYVVLWVFRQLSRRLLVIQICNDSYQGLRYIIFPLHLQLHAYKYFQLCAYLKLFLKNVQNVHLQYK